MSNKSDFVKYVKGEQFHRGLKEGVSFFKDVAYSYKAPIALRDPRFGFVISNRSYSRSTNKHISMVSSSAACTDRRIIRADTELIHYYRLALLVDQRRFRVGYCPAYRYAGHFSISMEDESQKGFIAYALGVFGRGEDQLLALYHLGVTHTFLGGFRSYTEVDKEMQDFYKPSENLYMPESVEGRMKGLVSTKVLVETPFGQTTLIADLGKLEGDKLFFKGNLYGETARSPLSNCSSSTVLFRGFGNHVVKIKPFVKKVYLNFLN
jgi:hypothetical protein